MRNGSFVPHDTVGSGLFLSPFFPAQSHPVKSFSDQKASGKQLIPIGQLLTLAQSILSLQGQQVYLNRKLKTFKSQRNCRQVSREYYFEEDFLAFRQITLNKCKLNTWLMIYHTVNHKDQTGFLPFGCSAQWKKTTKKILAFLYLMSAIPQAELFFMSNMYPVLYLAQSLANNKCSIYCGHDYYNYYLHNCT